MIVSKLLWTVWKNEWKYVFWTKNKTIEDTNCFDQTNTKGFRDFVSCFSYSAPTYFLPQSKLFLSLDN